MTTAKNNVKIGTIEFKRKNVIISVRLMILKLAFSLSKWSNYPNSIREKIKHLEISNSIWILGGLFSVTS